MMQIYTRDGEPLKVEVTNEQEHLVVTVNGKRWCSCDSLREVGEEIFILAGMERSEIDGIAKRA